MNKQVSVLGNMRIAGALILDQDNSEFPSNPKPGTLLIKGQDLFAYLTIGSIQTWYPLFQVSSNSYLHTQATPSLRWVVNHSLNTEYVWYQIKDANGNIVSEQSLEPTDNNGFILNFTEAFAGTVIVVGTNSVNLNNVNASLISVGAVRIDTSGVYINNTAVLTAANLTGAVNTAITALAGQANGLASLGVDGKVPTAQLPADIITSVAGKTGDVTLTAADVSGVVASSEVGAANGIAPLGADARIPSSFLPSYVDDVVEAADYASLPVTGEAGKIYVLLTPYTANGETNAQFRWSGSGYVAIVSSPGTTDAVPEGTTNKYFTNTRAAAAAPVQSVAGKTGAVTLVANDISGISTVGKTGAYADLTGKPSIPSLTSQLTNDSGYLTSAPVTTVAGRAGAVVLSQADIAGLTTGSSPTFAAVTAGNFNGALIGNASTATKLATARNIALTGDVVGTASFDGSADISIAITAKGDVVQNLGNVSGALAVNLGSGSYVSLTPTAATTLSVTGVPDSVRAYGLILEITNGGSNMTWPGSVTWVSGSAPTLKASGANLVSLVTRNGGTSWLGTAS